PVAMVDDDVEKRHLRIHGVPVEGGLSDVPEIIRKHEVEDVLVAMRGISPEKLRQLVSACEHAHVRFQILPSVQDVMSGRVSLTRFDLLKLKTCSAANPLALP